MTVKNLSPFKSNIYSGNCKKFHWGWRDMRSLHSLFSFLLIPQFSFVFETLTRWLRHSKQEKNWRWNIMSIICITWCLFGSKLFGQTGSKQMMFDYYSKYRSVWPLSLRIVGAEGCKKNLPDALLYSVLNMTYQLIFDWSDCKIATSVDCTKKIDMGVIAVSVSNWCDWLSEWV